MAEQQADQIEVTTFDRVSLNPLFVFGINTKATGCIVHLDTNHVLHPSGRYVAVSALDAQEMSFIPPRDGSVKGVTAMAISPNRKFLAVGERTTGSATSTTAAVAIMDLSTMSLPPKQTLTIQDAREVVSVAFSGDGHLLAVQTGRPDWNLLVFDWEKKRLVSEHKIGTAISKCSFNPWDSRFLATSGKAQLTLWHITDIPTTPQSPETSNTPSPTQLEQVPLNGLPTEGATRQWSSHTWMLGDVLIACTEEGEVVIFERATLRQSIKPFHAEAGLSCLAPLTKGIIAAGGGKLSILEGMEEGGQMGFAVRKTFDVPTQLLGFIKTEISCVSVPLSETNVCCATTTGQMFQLALDLPTNSFIVPQTPPSAIPPNPQTTTTSGGGLHNGAITGMDSAVRKPLAVTTGADGFIRVWNFHTKTCELAKQFKEDALCVAVHPLGLQMIVGFADKLKLCSILVDDIRVECCFHIKACREARFSTAGHLIAAVSPNGVHIYSSITCKLIAILRGHVGQVKAVAFSQNDQRLVTVSIDGAIFEWSTQTWQRIQDNVIKTCAYTAVTYDELGTNVICSSSDKMVRQLLDGKIVQQANSGADAVTALVYSNKHKAVISGSATGHIRVFEYPLTGAFCEYHVHSGGVSRLRLAPDGDSVLSAGEDGMLFVISISSAANLVLQNSPQKTTDTTTTATTTTKHDSDETRFLDLVLAGQLWMRNVFVEKKALLEKMDRVAQSVEAEVNARMSDFRKEVEKLTTVHENKLTEERQHVQNLLSEKARMEARHAEEMQAISANHSESLKSMDSVHKTEVDSLTNKLEQLQKEKDKEEKDASQRLEDEKKRNAAEIKELNERHANEMEAERRKYKALEQKMREEQELHDAEIRQQEEEYEYSLAKAKESASHMIQLERDSTGTLEKVGSQTRRRLEESLREQAVLREQLDKIQVDMEKAQKAIREKEDENSSLKRELIERSESVAQKEHRLSELKQRNQELEKFRYVLEYKIAELKDQLGPHEATIAAQKEQINAMNEELQRTFQKLEEMRLKENEHAQKVESFNRQLQQTKGQLAEKEKYIRTLVENLHRVFTEMDSVEWKNGFKKLYQTYVTEQASKTVSPEDQDRMQELARQREYMEHSLEVLKTKETRQEERHRMDLDRRTMENVQLIDELNRLRRENCALKEKIVSLQNRLESGTVVAQERVKASIASAEARRPTITAVGETTSSSKKHSRSPNYPPSTTALARSRNVEAANGSDADKSQIAHLEQLVTQKDKTIDQLKDEIERLAQQLAVLATSGGTTVTIIGEQMNGGSGSIARQNRPVSSPNPETKLPQITR